MIKRENVMLDDFEFSIAVLITLGTKSTNLTLNLITYCYKLESVISRSTSPFF